MAKVCNVKFLPETKLFIGQLAQIEKSTPALTEIGRFLHDFFSSILNLLGICQPAATGYNQRIEVYTIVRRNNFYAYKL